MQLVYRACMVLPEMLVEAAIANIFVVPVGDVDADDLARELEEQPTPNELAARAEKAAH